MEDELNVKGIKGRSVPETFKDTMEFLPKVKNMLIIMEIDGGQVAVSSNHMTKKDYAYLMASLQTWHYQTFNRK